MAGRNALHLGLFAFKATWICSKRGLNAGRPGGVCREPPSLLHFLSFVVRIPSALAWVHEQRGLSSSVAGACKGSLTSLFSRMKASCRKRTGVRGLEQLQRPTSLVSSCQGSCHRGWRNKEPAEKWIMNMKSLFYSRLNLNHVLVKRA